MLDRFELMEAGIDYDDGIKRFGNNEAIFEKYLLKMFDLNLMGQISEQIKAMDYDGAFRTAHDLKGVSGNLSMTKFNDSVCKLVEELRGGSPQNDVLEMCKTTEDIYNKAESAVRGN